MAEDMASAPRDGTPFLAWEESRKMWSVCRYELWQPFPGGAQWECAYVLADHAEINLTPEPTCWVELPSDAETRAPQAQSDDGKTR